MSAVVSIPEGPTAPAAARGNATPPLFQVSVFTNGGEEPLGKRIARAADGSIVKDALAQMTRGQVETVSFNRLSQFAQYRQQLGADVALAYGRCKYEHADVLTQKKIIPINPKTPVVARDAEHFHWAEGLGLLMIDYDPPGDPLEPDDLVATMRREIPALRGVTLLWCASASSCIVDEVTGATVRGVAGQRLYAIVRDARRIPVIGKLIFDRLVIAGHGRIALASNGNMLKRTLIDGAVWGPERLDFIRATCGPGLVQQQAEWRIYEAIRDDGELDDSETFGDAVLDPDAVPPLTTEEAATLQATWARLKAAAAPESKRRRVAWSAAKAREDAPPDASDEEIERRAARYERMAEGGQLAGDFILIAADGSKVLVQDLLDDPERYDGTRYADPGDSTEDLRVAVAMLKRTNGRGPTIYSHEHGSVYYDLVDLRDFEESPKPNLEDFHAYLPSHQYIYVPTRELWPAASVNGVVKPWPTLGDKALSPSAWLDQNRPVEQMTWCPGEPMIIENRLVNGGGWVPHPGARVLNQYREAPAISGDPPETGPWLDHLRMIYPDDAEHIVCWLAHRVQFPGVKLNHALVLGGDQGIGKDTILEPVKQGVGPWNWSEINPVQMLGRFNGWSKAVVVRISEARDLGDVDRYAFYDHSKTYITAPPDTLRVDEKNAREYPIFNVMGVIITTNHKTDGLYLPPDDRRHYVAWSPIRIGVFDSTYWTTLWNWYQRGGIGHVVAYLRDVDLTEFDPKAPPPKTPAFWEVVNANRAPGDSELADVIERLGSPSALTLSDIEDAARALDFSVATASLTDARNRRALPHQLDRAGYSQARNPNANDGMWKVSGRRVAIYARADLPERDRIAAAQARTQAAAGARSPEVQA